jgi:DNA ligase-1
MIRKPMKAPSTGATLQQLKDMVYPIACSPKLDGIRGVRFNDSVRSNSLKRLGNLYMQACLDDPSLIGLDGELIVGLPYIDFSLPDDDVFNRTSGAIRRSSGEPDFTFYVFDNFINKDLRYEDRWINPMSNGRYFGNPRVTVLEQKICHTWQEALAFEEACLAQGYEGMMARTLGGIYKEGRATNKEATILKRKPLEQSEGLIVGMFEQQKNNNEKAVNEMGESYRTSHKGHKVGKGTLGGVTLKDPRWACPANPGGTFNVGTIIGGSDAWRQEMWDCPTKLMGGRMTYVYQGIGSIDRPRQPRGKAELRWD